MQLPFLTQKGGIYDVPIEIFEPRRNTAQCKTDTSSNPLPSRTPQKNGIPTSATQTPPRPLSIDREDGGILRSCHLSHRSSLALGENATNQSPTSGITFARPLSREASHPIAQAFVSRGTRIAAHKQRRGSAGGQWSSSFARSEGSQELDISKASTPPRITSSLLHQDPRNVLSQLSEPSSMPSQAAGLSTSFPLFENEHLVPCRPPSLRQQSTSESQIVGSVAGVGTAPKGAVEDDSGMYTCRSSGGVEVKEGEAVTVEKKEEASPTGAFCELSAKEALLPSQCNEAALPDANSGNPTTTPVLRTAGLVASEASDSDADSSTSDEVHSDTLTVNDAEEARVTQLHNPRDRFDTGVPLFRLRQEVQLEVIDHRPPRRSGPPAVAPSPRPVKPY